MHPGAEAGPLRILLVEDEALIALSIQDMLESAGYTVVGPADRVDSALALAAVEPIDAATLDVNLAGVKVWPVAEVLCQRGIPFVFFSGAADVPPRFASTPRLGKPFTPSVLLAKLAEVLQAPALAPAVL